MKTQIKPIFFLFLFYLIGILFTSCSTNNFSPTSTQNFNLQTSTIPLKTNISNTAIASIPVFSSATTPKWTQTSTPEQTQTPIITQTVVNQKDDELNVYIVEASLSPYGEWAAVVFNDGEKFAMQIYSQREGWKRWNIIEVDEGEIRYIPWPLEWSEDGKYLYYTHQFRNRDGCFGYWASNGVDLYKLDLTNGESIQITSWLGYWLAISPDETRLAYLYNDRGVYRIGILELESDSSREAEVLNEEDESILIYPMDMIWSPNGEFLLVGVVVNVCTSEEEDSYSIIRVKASTFEQEILIEKNSQWIQPVVWEKMDKILLRDESGKYWWLNPETKQLEEKK